MYILYIIQDKIYLYTRYIRYIFHTIILWWTPTAIIIIIGAPNQDEDKILEILKQIFNV